MDHVTFPTLPSGRGPDDVLRHVKAAGERRRWRNRAVVALPLVLLAAAVLLFGPGDAGTRVLSPADGDGQDAAGPTVTTIPDGTGSPDTTGPGGSPTTVPSEPTVAVVFRGPLSLAAVQDVAARNGATVVALWRTDSVCVSDVSGGGGPASGRSGNRRSAFAYFEADKLVARQSASRTPVTDGGWTFALRNRFEQEWQAAQADEVRFRGAAFLLPSKNAAVQGADVARTEPVPSYLTDQGVLYLRGHEGALAPHFPDTDTSAC